MAANKDWSCPEWITEALQTLRPPGRMTVSEWADARRVLDAKTSSMPGRWSTDQTPYLREIMDAFNDPEIEEISLMKSTQIGGTEAMLNMLGYVIDQDPSASMIVYPTKELGEFSSKNRIQTMVDLCPELREKYDAGSKLLELQFSEMYLVISGANSPATLASYPIRYLFMDEVDKYPENAGKEADPRALARERTNSYRDNRKIISVSTPTYEDGNIYKDWLAADEQNEYWVTCPECGAQWSWEFKQLKFDNSSPEMAQQTAMYCCKECGAMLSDAQHNRMNQQGFWKKVKSSGRQRVAFRMNVFASPFIRLGDIARQFEVSRKDKAQLMNFINSWLAEPWKEVEETTNAEYLLEQRQGQYKKQVVPPGTVLITGGVDVQKNCFYWTIRGWRANMTSFNIDHGKAFSWREIEYIMNRSLVDPAGKGHIVNLCCVDSGDQTDDVYDFCVVNSEWAVPIKGASGRLSGRFRRTTIDRVDSKARGHTLIIVDTIYYKDMLASRMRRSEEDGGWFTHIDCDPDYCEMVTAEQKVVRKRNGRMESVWEPKAVGRDNHYLDAEVYAALAADLLGIREINAEQAVAQVVEEPVAAVSHGSSGGNNYFTERKGWFG